MKTVTFVGLQCRAENVTCAYHRHCHSFPVALYRNGFFPSHPVDPSIVFDELVMDVLYYHRFAALLSVLRGVKAISHFQLFAARLELDGDLSTDYDRLNDALPYYAALKAAINRLSQLDLGRPPLPLCPACSGFPHLGHTDACFQVARQLGATVSTRSTIFEGEGIVVATAAHQKFMELIDTPERLSQEKRRKDKAASRQLEQVCFCMCVSVCICVSVYSSCLFTYCRLRTPSSQWAVTASIERY